MSKILRIWLPRGKLGRQSPPSTISPGPSAPAPEREPCAARRLGARAKISGADQRPEQSAAAFASGARGWPSRSGDRKACHFRRLPRERRDNDRGQGVRLCETAGMPLSDIWSSLNRQSVCYRPPALWPGLDRKHLKVGGRCCSWAQAHDLQSCRTLHDHPESICCSPREIEITAPYKGATIINAHNH
jgi:hypothetical protein